VFPGLTFVVKFDEVGNKICDRNKTKIIHKEKLDESFCSLLLITMASVNN
jgi:hypothetical protein